MSGAGKYADYAIVVKADSKKQIWFEPRPPFEVLRVHVYIARVPSLKEIQIRHFCDATAADRAEIESWDMRRFVERYQAGGKFRKRRSTHGVWYFYLNSGTMIDDPLANLELEIMADRGSGVTFVTTDRTLAGVETSTGGGS